MYLKNLCSGSRPEPMSERLEIHYYKNNDANVLKIARNPVLTSRLKKYKRVNYEQRCRKRIKTRSNCYGPRCREFESSHARTNPLESFSRGFFCFLLGSLPGQTLFYSSFAGNSYFSKSSHRPGFYVIM